MTPRESFLLKGAAQVVAVRYQAEPADSIIPVSLHQYFGKVGFKIVILPPVKHSDRFCWQFRGQVIIGAALNTLGKGSHVGSIKSVC